MQVDIGNNKILDNYRTILSSPHLKALHDSREGEAAPGDAHSSSGGSSSSSSGSDEREHNGEGAHRDRHPHRRHRRSYPPHSQSTGSANNQSRQVDGDSPVPDVSVHRTPNPSRRPHRNSYVVPVPLRVTDSLTPLGLPPTPNAGSNPNNNHHTSGAVPQRSASREDARPMNGERAGGSSNVQVGGADPQAAQRRSNAARKIESTPHRGSSQNVDGASDDNNNNAKGGDNNNNNKDRQGDEAGKPAKPKLAQTNVQPGMQLKHWVVVSRIGAGSFGETFSAVEVNWAAPAPSDDGFLVISPEAASLLEHLPPPEQRKEVCIKVEQENKNVLRLEALALKKVQPCKQVVRYLGSGCTCGMNFLVMEKLGNNLAELRRRSPHGTFNIYTTLRAGVSCLQAIREVHAQGLIHRDIKPSNFVTGLPGGPTWAVCYLIDFGLARRFMRSTGEIRPPRDSAGFRGTSRYASVSSHMHLELGRVDDLWSLLFMLVEFATGTLPWRKYKDKEDIGRCKEESIGPHLVRNLPREFQPFLAHLQTLRYEDEPDYDYLLSLMEKAIERRGYPPGKPVDWELDPVTMEAVAAQEEQASRPSPAAAAAAAAAAAGAGTPAGHSLNNKAPSQQSANQVAVPISSSAEFAQQPVSKRDRAGSRASSSQAADDAMSPSRAGNPTRVSVSEVEVGYDNRGGASGRRHDSYVEEPGVSVGQQRVHGSEDKDYSSTTSEDKDNGDDDRIDNKRAQSGAEFSPREVGSSQNRKDDSRRLPPSASAGDRRRPIDVDEAEISPDSAPVNGDNSTGPQVQPITAAGSQIDPNGITPPPVPPKKTKHKSKCNCVMM